MSTVAIVGASDKPGRYSYKAQAMLSEYGHRPRPVSPRSQDIMGIQTVTQLEDIGEPVDTVTLYLAPAHQGKTISGLLAIKPERVIFNPGTENPEAYPRLEAAGIRCIEACTLVLLRTGQFDDA
jgi:predicted CoA-binding protein